QGNAQGVVASGVTLPTSAAQRAAVKPGQKLIYGLRPEALSFADSGVAGEITMLEPTGPETYVSVKTAAGLLVVRAPGKVLHQVGDRVHLGWGTHDVHLFDAESQKRLAD
ncbi:TOBE domain-containing protein, partial [Sphaerotilus sp.]|uniref:TOBE domain-containing protein n=1 Tax=Sphaerotilus sp. TaxID=2093942 RepID=UPI0034E2DDC5